MYHICQSLQSAFATLSQKMAEKASQQPEQQEKRKQLVPWESVQLRIAAAATLPQRRHFVAAFNVTAVHSEVP